MRLMELSKENILDTYWPVIEAAVEVQAYYNGRKDGVVKICPDVTCEMITRLIAARKACPVQREVV
jgi:hypothetical protein